MFVQVKSQNQYWLKFRSFFIIIWKFSVTFIEYTTTVFIAPNKNNSTCISSVLIGHSIMPNNVTISSQTYYDLAILQSFLPVT